MKVLVACEFSGVVRDAFTEAGHDAWSCDYLPCDTGGQHLVAPAEWVIKQEKWDLMIAHPPCTHLAVSGGAWFKDKKEEQEEALDFVRLLMNADIPRIAIENPVSIIASRIRPSDQVIQPWMFGHGESKATCFWLKNLPKLIPTHRVHGFYDRTNKVAKGPMRGHERSRTLPGIARAMAKQWGGVNG